MGYNKPKRDPKFYHIKNTITIKFNYNLKWQLVTSLEILNSSGQVAYIILLCNSHKIDFFVFNDKKSILY